MKKVEVFANFIHSNKGMSEARQIGTKKSTLQIRRNTSITIYVLYTIYNVVLILNVVLMHNRIWRSKLKKT